MHPRDYTYFIYPDKQGVIVKLTQTHQPGECKLAVYQVERAMIFRQYCNKQAALNIETKGKEEGGKKN